MDTHNTEEKITDIINQFQQYKETHPNFVRIWTTYLNTKFNNLKQTIKNCEELLETDIKNAPDLDINILITMLSFV